MKHLLVEDFITILSNLTFFLNQSLNRLAEVVDQLVLGYQQEYYHYDSKNTDLFSVNNSSNNSPTLLNQNNRLGVIFNGNYMKQNKLGCSHGTVINIYIVYELKNRLTDNVDFTVSNGLFGAVELTKNVNTSHYQYSMC